MPYSQPIQANNELFEKMQFISINDDIYITTIFPQNIDTEALYYYQISNQSDIKKYIPNAYAETLEQAKQKIFDSMRTTLLKGSLFYCIRFRKTKIPMGYINFSTPIAPTGLKSWSVDYWLSDEYTGQGLMTVALSKMLEYLQTNQVSEVKALVYSSNVKSINLLRRVGFECINQEQGGKMRFLYSIRLR